MANIPTVSWDETKPAGTRDANLGDDDIREYKTQVREILAQDHKVASSGQDTDWGFHQKVSLLVQASLAALANAFRLFSKDVSSKAELHGVDEDGNEVQITSGGKILGDNVRLSNNTNLTAKDAAGTSTVDLIKANTDDVPEIPDGAVMASSGAPTDDAGIANKAYVDAKANKGANTDITSLGGLTTALSTAQGGTGRITAMSASGGYSGSTAGQSIAHGLGRQPVFVSILNVDNAEAESMWFTGLTAIKYNGNSDIAGSVDATNIVFTGGNVAGNYDGRTYLFFCW